MNKRYVIYARTAAVMPSNQPGSVEWQLEKLTRFSKKHNLQVIQAFVERGISGIDRNRIGFKLILEMLSNGEIDGVICTSWDRLTRDLADTAYINRLILEKGVEIVTPKKTYRNNPEFRQINSILSQVASMESRLHSEWIKRGLREKRSKG